VLIEVLHYKSPQLMLVDFGKVQSLEEHDSCEVSSVASNQSTFRDSPDDAEMPIGM
jgi:hypothetical protein